MAIIPLGAVDSVGVQESITLVADHLAAIVLLGQLAEGRFHEATLQVPSAGGAPSGYCSLRE